MQRITAGRDATYKVFWNRMIQTFIDRAERRHTTTGLAL
jgi:hypothetical protein